MKAFSNNIDRLTNSAQGKPNKRVSFRLTALDFCSDDIESALNSTIGSEARERCAEEGAVNEASSRHSMNQSELPARPKSDPIFTEVQATKRKGAVVENSQSAAAADSSRFKRIVIPQLMHKTCEGAAQTVYEAVDGDFEEIDSDNEELHQEDPQQVGQSRSSDPYERSGDEMELEEGEILDDAMVWVGGGEEKEVDRILRAIEDALEGTTLDFSNDEGKRQNLPIQTRFQYSDSAKFSGSVRPLIQPSDSARLSHAPATAHGANAHSHIDKIVARPTKAPYRSHPSPRSESPVSPRTRIPLPLPTTNSVAAAYTEDLCKSPKRKCRGTPFPKHAKRPNRGAHRVMLGFTRKEWERHQDSVRKARRMALDLGRWPEALYG